MKAVASIIYSDVPGFPPGTTLDHIEVGVTGPNGQPVTQALASGATAATFDNLDPGSYTGFARGVDAGGGTLGSPVNFSFSLVVQGSVTLSLPSSVNASQA